MLYLKQPSRKMLDTYSKEIVPEVIKNLDNVAISGFLNPEAIDFLREKIPNILKAQPQKLKKLNEDFFKKTQGILNSADYVKFLTLADSQDQKTQDEKTFITNFKKELKKLRQIFDYDTLISANKERSYRYAVQMGTHTCIYCNRLYANVIEKKAIGEHEKISRAFFDHWYPKSKYPILSLSYFNLIPSCSVCNTSIKGSRNIDIDTHIHPYINDTDNDFRFSYEYKSPSDYSIVIRDSANLSMKAKNTIDYFKILEVLGAHSDKELKDLIDLKYKYSNNYLTELFEHTFKNLEVGDEEIYRMVFGIETNSEQYHKRPFSKLKHDIINEMRNR